MMHTNTARLRDEAMELSTQMRDWLERARDQSLERLPDRERILEEAEQLRDNLGHWMASLPAVVAEGLGYQRKPSRARSTFRWILIAGTGATVMYYFDPSQGAARRRGLMEALRGMSGGSGRPSPDGHRGEGTENVSLSQAGTET